MCNISTIGQHIVIVTKKQTNYNRHWFRLIDLQNNRNLQHYQQRPRNQSRPNTILSFMSQVHNTTIHYKTAQTD